MAVDPITAKILAQLAVQVATDEQARKRLLIIILAPVIFLLALIALIVYLITSPFSMLSGWLVGDERWADEPYGSDKIGTHACSPTAMSIVVSSLSSETVDQPHMAQVVRVFCETPMDNGGYCAGNGSYHKLIPDAAKAWGLSCEVSPVRTVMCLSRKW